MAKTVSRQRLCVALALALSLALPDARQHAGGGQKVHTHTSKKAMASHPARGIGRRRQRRFCAVTERLVSAYTVKRVSAHTQRGPNPPTVARAAVPRAGSRISRAGMSIGNVPVGRCDDLFQALSVHAQREGFTSDAAGHTRPDAVHPVVYVLKLNPNTCDAPKAAPFERRIQALADRINAIFDLPRDALVDAVVRGDAETLVPRVELFYYHTKRAAHHLQAYREAHDKGSLWFAGNVVS